MAHEVKFRLGSEHKIDSVYFDLEFQMYFISKNPANGFSYGAISILFNRTNYTDAVEGGHTNKTVEIIDSFFDSLELTDLTDEADPTDTDKYPLSKNVKELKLGDLFKEVNLKRRWIYMGSTTMPPCQLYTYWNVLSTIYPIKEKHYKLLKSQHRRNPKIEKIGNFRKIQNKTAQDPMYISDIGKDLPIFDIMEPYLIVLGAAIGIFFCLYIYMTLVENTQINASPDENDAAQEPKSMDI